MTIREAKEIARLWANEEAAKLPGYLGSFLSGSTSHMPDDATYPSSSDVDIWMVQEGATDWASIRKLAWRGIIIEAVIFSPETLLSRDGVLGNPFFAGHLAAPCVLADPSGRLTTVQEGIEAEYAKVEWVRKRVYSLRDGLDRCLGMLVGTVGPEWGPETGQPILDQAAGLTYVLEHISLMPVIADLAMPTLFKCLLRSRTTLERHSRLPFQHTLLELLGSAAMSRDEAVRDLEECTRAFERAMQVRKTPFFGDMDIAEHARPIVIGGPVAMIEDGYHREAMFPVLLVGNFFQRALQYDAPEAEKSMHFEGYRRILSHLGVDSSEKMRARVEEARTASAEAMRISEAIIASRS